MSTPLEFQAENVHASVRHDGPGPQLVLRVGDAPPKTLDAFGGPAHVDPYAPAIAELCAALAKPDAAFVRDVERALRCPPAALDDLDLAALNARPSEKWGTYPDPDVICCWVAEMDYPLARPIHDVLQRQVATDDVGYLVEMRETGLTEAFAARMDECLGWQVDPRRCEVLSEVVQGLYIALEAYSAPGEGAVVQTAIYPPFLSAVREMKRTLVDNRLVRSGDARDARFEIDFDALRRALSDGVDANTRTLLFCNPHNPTGRVFDRSELEALAEIALANDLVVVSDEIHSDLVFDGREHIPFATLSPEIEARTVTLTSATKAFNIPGLRTAIAHFGSKDLHDRFNGAVNRHIRGGIGLLGVYATIAAWQHSQPWVEQVRDHLQANRDFTTAFLRERCPELRFAPQEATYLMWFDTSAYGLEPSPARFFYEHGRIAMSDGRMFGPGHEDFVRLNIATSRPILAEILERFANALDGA